jgi:hypothetical protein
MFGKDSNKIHDLSTGVTGALWQQLKYKKRSGDILLTFVEFRTSKV